MEKKKENNDIRIRTLWLPGDAVVYGLALFKAIEYSRLYMDNAAGAAGVVAITATAGAIYT